MSPKNNAFSKLLASGKTLVLRDPNGGSHGIPYTKEEHHLCLKTLVAVLMMGGFTDLMENKAEVAKITEELEKDSTLIELIQSSEESDVVGICRDTYRSFARSVVEHNAKEENAGNQIPGFPKVRDATSIQNSLFRGACEKVGIKDIEAVFKHYGKPPAKKGAKKAV